MSSADVDARLAGLDDWRGDLLRQVRAAIGAVLPDVEEAVKWRKPSNPLGVPTWSHGGILCTGETYKDKVKLTFMHGNRLDDVDGLFTDEPTGTRRVIDLREGDALDAAKLGRLVRAAADYNQAR